MPTEGERTVDRLLTVYQRLDADGMLDCFTEDGAYHAMGMESAVGKDALRGCGPSGPAYLDRRVGGGHPAARGTTRSSCTSEWIGQRSAPATS